MLRPFLLLFLAVALGVPADAQKRPPSDSLETLRAEQAFVRGMTRAYVGDYEAAIQQYERALELRPGEAAVLAALAEAHEAEGDASTALYFAARAVEAAPTEPSVAHHLARLQVQAGETDAAIQTYRRLLALDPDDVGALEALAALDPADAALRDRLAGLHRAQSGEAKAADLDAEPTDDDLLLTGERRFRDGDWAGAAEALQQALAADPLHPPAWAQLVEAHVRSGNPEAALDAADEAMLLFPGQVALVRAAALAHAAAGRPGEAVRLFEEALDLLAEDPADGDERGALLDALDLASGLAPEDRQRLRDRIESNAP